MIISKTNMMFYGASGKLGPFIVRQRNGKTVVYARPVSATNWAPTPRQKENREKFRKANEFGKKAMADPTLHSFYSSMLKKKKNKNLTVQLIAIRDFRKAPKVTDIEVQESGNQALICVKAQDDTKVISVEVTLIDRDGQVVTSGMAILEKYESYWEFNAGELPCIPGGFRIEAIASDMAGNTGTLSTLHEPKGKAV